VPTPDENDGFEAYLKQFRPVAPDALPQRIQQSRRSRSLLWMWAAGFATVAILGSVALQVSSRVRQQGTAPARVEAVRLGQPLTIRNANALLAAAPSYKAAMDSMVFQHQDSTIPENQQSALAVLAKEKIKL
jgi:hypothetical protein